VRRARLAAAALLAAPTLHAQSAADPPLSGVVAGEGSWVVYAASANAGTHLVSVGGDAAARRHLGGRGGEEQGADVALTAGMGARYAARGLGIPGDRLEADAGVGLELSFGGERWTRDVHRGPERRRAHGLSYTLLGYASTDGTSQLSGALAYHGTGPEGHVVSVVFENDFLALQRLDRFCTFALRVRYQRPRADGIVVGAGASLVLWTGTTEGLGVLDRGERYDLRGQYGGEYSHGILVLDIYRGPLRLSLGYDAERIRTAVQNSFHYLIDDGYIPALNRNSRVYLQLSLNDLGPLY
jgi:hypothetical protein